MRTTAKRNRSGFTLLEALVASVILAAAVMTICSLSGRCTARAALNRQYDRAWQILDRQLASVDCVGIEEILQQGPTEGRIEGAGPVFCWRVGTSRGQLDNIYLVTLTVWWKGRGGHNYEVSAQTLFNGTGVLAIVAQDDS